LLYLNLGKVDIKSFKECLSSRPNNVYTTILACTDESEPIEYLNNWDKNIQRLGIIYIFYLYFSNYKCK